jgi:hypothetical protein
LLEHVLNLLAVAYLLTFLLDIELHSLSILLFQVPVGLFYLVPLFFSLISNPKQHSQESFCVEETNFWKTILISVRLVSNSSLFVSRVISWSSKTLPEVGSLSLFKQRIKVDFPPQAHNYKISPSIISKLTLLTPTVHFVFFRISSFETLS